MWVSEGYFIAYHTSTLQLICIHYSCFENMGWFVTLKKFQTLKKYQVNQVQIDWTKEF